MTTFPTVRRDAIDSPVADVAEWLAGVFRAPLAPEVIAAYRSSEGEWLLEAIAAELGSCRGIALMRDALRLGDSAATTQRRLSAAYSALFDGTGGPRTVSLQESHHAIGSARRFREATGSMERLLKRSSLAVRNDADEPADHLCVELALLAACLRRDDLDGVDSCLYRLSTWSPQFAVACHGADRTGFYAGASTALGELLASTHLDLHAGARPLGHASMAFENAS